MQTFFDEPVRNLETKFNNLQNNNIYSPIIKMMNVHRDNIFKEYEIGSDMGYYVNPTYNMLPSFLVVEQKCNDDFSFTEYETYYKGQCVTNCIL